jgi:hypothetical protein
MAVSTNAVKQVLRSGMGAASADALAAWMEAMQTALDTLAAQLDDDGGVTDTDYEAVVDAIITD